MLWTILMLWILSFELSVAETKEWTGNDTLCTVNGGLCTNLSACPLQYMAEDVCSGWPARVCCLHPPDPLWEQRAEDMSYWPKGSYGLPQSVYGCPGTDKFTWIESSSILTSGHQIQLLHGWSWQYHPRGPLRPDKVALNFCLKVERYLPEVVKEMSPIWPPGTYCVYRLGKDCPEGFTSDDVTIKSGKVNLTHHLRPSPLSMSDIGDLVIGMCCRQDGDPLVPILLPTPNPFILIKHHNATSCQNVKYMKNNLESSTLRIFSSPTNKTVAEQLKIFYCYYQAYETCYHEADNGRTYRGEVTFSKQGTCPRWDSLQGEWSTDCQWFLQYVIESNHCTGAKTYQPRPFCKIGDSYVTCAVPKCPDILKDLIELGSGYPVRQMVGTLYDARLAIDSSLETCSHQTGRRPWWQMDLRRVEVVVAILIHDNRGQRYCPWRLANVYVGMTSDDFQYDEALMCRRNHSYSDTKLLLQCRQPIRGQYVTIRQHAYVNVDDPQSEWIPKCLNICDVKVYVRRQTCGVPFESQDVVMSDQAVTSSTQEDLSNLELHSLRAWCAAPDDVTPFVQVDLLEVRQVTGLVTQGGDDVTVTEMVTEFTLHYGLREDGMIPYTEGEDTTPKTFLLGPDPHTPHRVVLSRPFWSRFIRLNLTSWRGRACLRIKVIGCHTYQANLAADQEVEVSVTSPVSGPSSRLTDGRLDTCWTSGRTLSPWVTLTLDDQYIVRDITLRKNWQAPGPSPCLYDNDQGFSYMGTVNITTSGQQCQAWSSDPQGAAGQNLPEWELRSAENFCRNPFIEPGPWCRTLDTDLECERCDIPKCAKLEATMEVYVSNDVRASVDDQKRWELCGKRPFRLDQNVIGMRCTSDVKGQKILIKFPDTTLLHLCEIRVHGSFPAIMDDTATGSEVKCLPSQLLLPAELSELNTSHTPIETNDTLVMGLETVQLMASTCNGIRCVIPGVKSEDQRYTAKFECVHRRKEVTWLGSSRRFNVSQEGEVLHLGLYLLMYDTDSTWTWDVTAPEGKYAEVSITSFTLGSPEKVLQEGFHTVDPGTCADSLWVTYPSFEWEDKESPMVVFGSQTFISSSPRLRIIAHTCYKLDPIQQKELSLDATYSQKDCYGCEVGKGCTSLNSCTNPCGYILSPNFPLPYEFNQKCSWNITVSRNAYIRLEFLDFDVFEEEVDKCHQDHVEVMDRDRQGTERSLGRFCNTYLPPDHLLSSWNGLRVILQTDGTRNAGGFRAKYESMVYKYKGDEAFNDTKLCPPQWKSYENHCIRIFNETEPITWLEAEYLCQNYGAHLLSIRNKEEMMFVNSLLVGSHGTDDIYIGLNDRKEEGLFKWIDNSPMSYSNWQIGQPNGGDIEDCSVIRLQSIRFQPSWQDIPCASSSVHRFACKQRPGEKTRLNIFGTVDEVSDSSCPSDMFECDDGECILLVHVCNGYNDCMNGTDERSNVCGNTCPYFSFTCSDSSCISMSLVCNGENDCPSGHDEAHCVFRNCTEEEYTCRSGGCVPLASRCDQLEDCFDKSDETECETCSEAATFQCYSGKCIPKSRLCDYTLDCPGQLHEDEDPAQCLRNGSVSCKDWRMKGFTENGRYQIRLPEGDTADVECDMTSYPNQVVTIVHHNSEANTSVKGFEAPSSYKRNITYFATFPHMRKIRSEAVKCEMAMEVVCFNAEAMANSGWVGEDGKYRRYNYDQPPPGSNCSCRLSKACDEGQKSCYCTLPKDNVLSIDRGNFTDTNKTLLPIRQITLEDTGAVYETLSYKLGPFRCYHEFDEEKAAKRCKNGQSFSPNDECLYDTDQYGTLKGCRDATHLENCENFTCPDDFVKCPNSYCLAVFKVCDGTQDCPGGEDEFSCDEYQCAGMMKCLNRRNCIPLSQRCDGQRQCDLGDDEWFCDAKCPAECQCHVLTYKCEWENLTHIPTGISKSARKLLLNHNRLELTVTTLTSYPYISELFLTHNGIQYVQPNTFSTLHNLQILDLSFNEISRLDAYTFIGLGNIHSLNVRENPIISIETKTFVGLQNLQMLSLKRFQLEVIEENTFNGLYKLKTLDISRNSLSVLKPGAFNSLINLKYLNISQNQITSFEKNDFRGLSSLIRMESDDALFCCFVKINEKDCLPQPDAFSSCTDLMTNNVLRIFLWILGVMAFVGNIIVLGWRMNHHEGQKVPNILLCNLSIADFLMGFYMLVIAATDLYYRGNYIENAKAWKTSALCQFLGFLSTVSSEASVLSLCIITYDRLFNITFPFSQRKLKSSSAKTVIVVSWLIAIIIGAVPLLPSDYFQGQFYSRSSVCVSLHITQEATPGWEFSVAIFHGLNFFTFVFIFIAYSFMYRVIKGLDTTADVIQKKREMTAARKMTLIVATDFLCWVPINIMGVLAIGGVPIPGDIYAWTVVFILPVNSALNPLLYSFSNMSLPCRKKTTSSESKGNMSSHKTITDGTDPNLFGKQVTISPNASKGPNQRTLGHHLTSNQLPLQEVAVILTVARQVATLLTDIHTNGFYLGNLDVDTVWIEYLQNNPVVTLQGCPLSVETCEQGQSKDIELFGRLVTRLLTARTVAFRHQRSDSRQT